MTKKSNTSLISIKTGLPDDPKGYTSETIEESVAKSIEYAQNAIETYDPAEMRGMVSQWVSDNIIRPIDFYVERKQCHLFSAEDAQIVLLALKKIVSIVNTKIPFSPTIFTYAQLAGRSVELIKRIAQQNDERGEQIRLVYDYISESLLQGATSGDIPQIPAIFIAKATLGMRENEPTTQINIMAQGETSVEQIMNEYSNKIKLFEKK